jgi:hypothetical protein
VRKSAKALLLVLVALIGSIVLSIAAAFSAAFAFGAAVGLIVPGTGTHDIATVTGYKSNAAIRYINPAGTPVCSVDSCLVGVDYPATFFPLVIFPGWCPGLSCDTWNKSVGTGVTNLDAAVNTALADENNDHIVIFGYSQGGAVVSQELIKLNNDPTLTQADKDRITAVTIGNINNPLGLWSRLSFLPTSPILDISFGPQLPTTGIKSTNYSFEYDPVGDAPQYWGNPLTMLNALAAFEYVHGYYLSPNSNGETDQMPYGYNDATLAYAIAHTDHIQYNDATFVLIPQQGALPIFQPFVDLANATGTRALVDPVITLVQPVTKVLIDLGYDRETNPGIPRTLSILPFNPFQNWFKVGEDLANGAVEGVADVVNGVDVTKPPTTPPADAPLVGGSPFTSQTNAGTSSTNLVSKQTTVVDKNAVAKLNDPGAKLKAVVTRDKDVANEPGNKLKAAADKVGAEVKATVDKVNAAVGKVAAPKDAQKDEPTNKAAA